MKKESLEEYVVRLYGLGRDNATIARLANRNGYRDGYGAPWVASSMSNFLGVLRREGKLPTRKVRKEDQARLQEAVKGEKERSEVRAALSQGKSLGEVKKVGSEKSEKGETARSPFGAGDDINEAGDDINGVGDGRGGNQGQTRKEGQSPVSGDDRMGSKNGKKGKKGKKSSIADKHEVKSGRIAWSKKIGREVDDYIFAWVEADPSMPYQKAADKLNEMGYVALGGKPYTRKNVYWRIKNAREKLRAKERRYKMWNDVSAEIDKKVLAWLIADPHRGASWVAEKLTSEGYLTKGGVPYDSGSVSYRVKKALARIEEKNKLREEQAAVVDGRTLFEEPVEVDSEKGEEGSDVTGTDEGDGSGAMAHDAVADGASSSQVSLQAEKGDRPKQRVSPSFSAIEGYRDVEREMTRCYRFVATHAKDPRERELANLNGDVHEQVAFHMDALLRQMKESVAA